jgi:Cu-Zn family superoxide dismutase
MIRHLLPGLLALGAAGCASTPAPEDEAATVSTPAALTADIADAAGRVVARATASQVGADVRLHLEAAGLARGAYGAHVHDVGRCDPPSFTTAGAHWNPAARQHGKDNPQGMHKGDLPNLLVGTDGRGSFEITVADARLEALAGGDGTALVIHAGPDDYRTDPSGNSGARIACGVLR